MEPLHLDDDDPPRHEGWRRVGTIALGVGILVAAVMGVRAFLAHPVDKGPVIRQIALINQPPPPPPKPPEKPPEPPKVKDEVKVDTPHPDPKPEAEKPPESPPPGLTSALKGEGGPDFGASYDAKGSSIGSPGGTGTGGAYYTGLLQRQFFEALSRNRKMLHDEFRVVVKIWISDDGRVSRADIVSGSGAADIDQRVQVTLMEMPPLKEVPPAYLRPIEVRLSNRS